jgi:hypothetical protein
MTRRDGQVANPGRIMAVRRFHTHDPFGNRIEFQPT